MPQMDEATTKKFIEHLADKGHKVTNEDQYASYLRATQNELNGGKVAGIAKSMRSGEHEKGPEAAQVYKPPRMVVSTDDYILDGHHRWAAKVGNDSIDGILTNDTKIEISRVDMTITQLLEEADKFTGGKGRKGVGDRRFAKDFNPHHEPAGSSEGGRFASGPGGGGGSESESGGAGGETKGLDPEAIDVGGDKWNRDTAIRLEREYQNVKPHLEKLAESVVGQSATTEEDDLPPEEWEAISSAKQQEIADQYAKHAFQEMYESEVDNWHSEQAPKDAARMVVDDFNDGTETEWVGDAITGLRQDDGEAFPLSDDKLVEAIKLSNEDGEGELKVEFDEDVLRVHLEKPKPDEPQFEGFEEGDAAKLLTKEMRDEITATLKADFNSARDEALNKHRAAGVPQRQRQGVRRIVLRPARRRRKIRLGEEQRPHRRGVGARDRDHAVDVRSAWPRPAQPQPKRGSGVPRDWGSWKGDGERSCRAGLGRTWSSR